MKAIGRAAVMVALLQIITVHAVALSLPWWTARHSFTGTIGCDQTLRIPLMTEIDDGHYRIDVFVEGEDAHEVGPALAGLLWGDHDFGGVLVMVRGWTPDGSPIAPLVPDASDDAIVFLWDMVNAGFRHNPLFVEATDGGAIPFVPAFPDVIAVFESEVIEYWDDDLGDWFRYRHLIAQDAFAEVMHTDYSDGGATLGVATEPRWHWSAGPAG